MNFVYVIVFMYMGRIYCKIGHGPIVSRLASFKAKAPFGVQVITSHCLPTVANPKKVETVVHKHFENVRCWKLLPGCTTEVFDIADVEKVLSVMDRAIVTQEAGAIKRNKHAPRFLQINLSLADIDKICAYAVARNPLSICLLDDRDGEVFRALVDLGYNAKHIVPIDTRNGYPEAFMQFDLVIMNPPFTGVQNPYLWKQFVSVARKMLTESGKLIAVLPQHKDTVNREWLHTIATDIKFENAGAVKGIVVVMDSNGIPEPAGKKEKIKIDYSAIAALGYTCILFSRGTKKVDTLGRAIRWDRYSPRAAVITNGPIWPERDVLAITGPNLEKLLPLIQQCGEGFNSFTNAVKLLDAVRSCSSTS